MKERNGERERKREKQIELIFTDDQIQKRIVVILSCLLPIIAFWYFSLSLSLVFFSYFSFLSRLFWYFHFCYFLFWYFVFFLGFDTFFFLSFDTFCSFCYFFTFFLLLFFPFVMLWFIFFKGILNEKRMRGERSVENLSSLSFFLSLYYAHILLP